jgi:hypothetical protein
MDIPSITMDYADCWPEDGELSWTARETLKGRAAILSAFRAHTHAPVAFHKHFVIEPLIWIRGDRTNADSMFARLDSYAGIPQMRSFARYRDVLIRCPDGRWRCRERKAELGAKRPGTPSAAAP